MRHTKAVLDVVLASASPRRRVLLGELIPSFRIVVSEVDEDALTTSDPVETAERLARAKAEAVLAREPDSLVIGADTVVSLEVENQRMQLAKPVDVDDAQAMLRKLSGRTHMVTTGVCLASRARVHVFSDSTRVTFRHLSTEEIASYVQSGEPMDKAGSYAIQGGAASFVDRIDGSLTNVVGLPMERLAEELERFSS